MNAARVSRAGDRVPTQQPVRGARAVSSAALWVGAARRMSMLLIACAATVAPPSPANAQSGADASLAQQHWVLNCMGCHTATGGGIPGKVPPLAHSLGYFEHLPAGREYVMRVPGASNSALSDQELADVLNWLLTTMNHEALPKDFKPYTAAEVSARRRPALSDVATVRAGLIRDLHERGIKGVADRY
ncbi:cytochrome c [Paraburkholderia caribensis]|uniref:Cytochrome C n=1 Tax=Paraburkholderia caribensis TaxID=75105 RepID=A0A9Q6WNE9_9BURK|nr:cytochrome c [Paraburkholderia caribensis]MCO4876133.1 cytochrome c [Paraburkholderia caribensis]PTB29508.1 cytochrome C [Paraburkholderia caribensis]QLB64789.1 cytochrome C [Paraburkholderia caribensis]